jgi:hypothetical protein
VFHVVLTLGPPGFLAARLMGRRQMQVFHDEMISFNLIVAGWVLHRLQTDQTADVRQL